MKSDPRDYQIDIAGMKKPDVPAPAAASTGRPFLSVLFNCCQVYQRVYRSVDGRDYQGRCPKCGRSVKFVVGPGGTGERSFVVE